MQISPSCQHVCLLLGRPQFKSQAGVAATETGGGFSLFYSVPRREFEGRITDNTMTAFFHFLCNSLLAIFRRFVDIRSYTIKNGNVGREVKNKKVNKLRFICFSSIFVCSILCLTTDPIHQGHEKRKKSVTSARSPRNTSAQLRER